MNIDPTSITIIIKMNIDPTSITYHY